MRRDGGEAYVFERWARISTASTGLTAGAVIGFIMTLGFDFTLYATTNVANLTATLVDPLAMTVAMGGAGAVVGATLGKLPS